MSNNFKVIQFRINDNDEVILSRDTLTYLLECKKMRDNKEYGKEVVDKFKIRISDKISEYNQELREQQQRIDRAIEYHDNCLNNLLDLDKIEENERLAYQVAYEIHDNYLRILKGSESNE